MGENIYFPKQKADDQRDARNKLIVDMRGIEARVRDMEQMTGTGRDAPIADALRAVFDNLAEEIKERDDKLVRMAEHGNRICHLYSQDASYETRGRVYGSSWTMYGGNSDSDSD